MLGLKRVVCLIIFRFRMKLCLLDKLVIDVIWWFWFDGNDMVFMFIVFVFQFINMKKFVMVKNVVNSIIDSIFIVNLEFFQY